MTYRASRLHFWVVVIVFGSVVSAMAASMLFDSISRGTASPLRDKIVIGLCWLLLAVVPVAVFWFVRGPVAIAELQVAEDGLAVKFFRGQPVQVRWEEVEEAWLCETSSLLRRCNVLTLWAKDERCTWQLVFMEDLRKQKLLDMLSRHVTQFTFYPR
jgi:hypothetical protein